MKSVKCSRISGESYFYDWQEAKVMLELTPEEGKRYSR